MSLLLGIVSVFLLAFVFNLCQYLTLFQILSNDNAAPDGLNGDFVSTATVTAGV